MKISHNSLNNNDWLESFDLSLDSKNTIVFIFSQLSKDAIQIHINHLVNIYPKSHIFGCSTAGQIFNGKLLDASVLVSVIKFEKNTVSFHSTEINDSCDSFSKGLYLANQFSDITDLNNLIVLSEGLNINGSQLIDGFNSVIEDKLSISGGLAGDDDKFSKTWVINHHKQAKENCIATIGLSGPSIQSKNASKGGWDMIGIDRQVTKSIDNILYELDHKPALKIYKEYLGEYSNKLPSSGLLFPLSIIDKYDQSLNKVRTILAVNHEENSITFAGDIPTGSVVRLMHANFDRLIDGADDATQCLIKNTTIKNQNCFCLSISCVGRKLILGQRAEEEIEAVQDSIPTQCQQIGFYSYGELSPQTNGICDLHNQTMTLTLIWEE
ncbi:MAG: FIST signal transduction protein [Marinicellaceae bacterium]